MRRVARAVIAAAVAGTGLAALAGCGQKGPLMLPGKTPAASAPASR